MNLPPMPPLPPIPPLPQPTPKWELRKAGYNTAHLRIDCTLTRHEVFRLIGELERLGGSL